MDTGSSSVERLIAELGKLPGIGRKSAQRLTFHILKEGREKAEALSQAILALKDNVGYCSICLNITETDPCSICSSSRRNRATICVVEEPGDVFALEKTGEYTGLYHVLGGALSPLDSIGPEDLNIKTLLRRLDQSVKEVILANNPSTEGEATSIYLSGLIKPLGIKVSRIAQGLPMGGALELADQVTLARALEGRREVS